MIHLNHTFREFGWSREFRAKLVQMTSSIRDLYEDRREKRVQAQKEKKRRKKKEKNREISGNIQDAPKQQGSQANRYQSRNYDVTETAECCAMTQIHPLKKRFASLRKITARAAEKRIDG